MRIVAATNREPRALVERGEFREDLYYRLCVVSIRVPPLRDRPDEIPVLIRQFLDTYALRDQRPRPRPSAATMDRLLRYHWPGNVRELENVIRQIVLLGEDARLLDSLLMPATPAPIRRRSRSRRRLPLRAHIVRCGGGGAGRRRRARAPGGGAAGHRAGLAHLALAADGGGAPAQDQLPHAAPQDARVRSGLGTLGPTGGPQDPHSTPRFCGGSEERVGVSRNATALPWRDERRGAWGARSRPPIILDAQAGDDPRVGDAGEHLGRGLDLQRAAAPPRITWSRAISVSST